MLSGEWVFRSDNDTMNQQYSKFTGQMGNLCQFPHTLHLVPRVISLGIGCRKGASAGAVEQTVREALGGAGLPLAAVKAWAVATL